MKHLVGPLREPDTRGSLRYPTQAFANGSNTVGFHLLREELPVLMFVCKDVAGSRAKSDAVVIVQTELVTA